MIMNVEGGSFSFLHSRLSASLIIITQHNTQESYENGKEEFFGAI